MVADVVVSTAKSFPDAATLALVSDVQFREPYSSGAINRKFRGIVDPGIYKGFVPSPAGGLTLQITSGEEGGTASVNIDKFYQLTVRQQADVTLKMTAGKTAVVVLEASYVLGQETYQVNANSAIQAVEIKILDKDTKLNANQLELCTVIIPAGATELTEDMIDLTGRKLVNLGTEYSNDYDSDEEGKAATPKAVKEGLSHKQPLDQTLTELSGKSIEQIIEYLRLGEGSLLPVGTPIPWPLAIPPDRFLKLNGAPFDMVANPKLALAYPSGILPDMRGQSIRGWDDGRNIDKGRVLLSEQDDAQQNIVGSVANVYTDDPNVSTGVLSYGGDGFRECQSGAGTKIQFRNLSINTATQVRTASEVRVKNVAYNYIVRAQ